jgi:hypothetical protein
MTKVAAMLAMLATSKRYDPPAFGPLWRPFGIC